MAKTHGELFLENPDNMRLFQEERSVYKTTELLQQLMETLDISRADLARLLKTSPGWITQLLDEEKNNTIRTIAGAFAVLGFEFTPTCKRIQRRPSSSVATYRMDVDGRSEPGASDLTNRIATIAASSTDAESLQEPLKYAPKIPA